MIKLLLLILAINGSGDIEPKDQYWYCKTMGHLYGKPSLIITKIWKDDHDVSHKTRANHYSNYIGSMAHASFYPSFIAKCRWYPTKKKAKENIQKEINMAHKYNFKVIEEPWQYHPSLEDDKDVQEQAKENRR